MLIVSSDQRMFFLAESFDGISIRQRGMSHQVRVYLKTGAALKSDYLNSEEEARAYVDYLDKQLPFLRLTGPSKNEEDKLKSYTLDEVTDEMIGEKGTPERDAYEKKLKVDVYISNLLDRVKHEFIYNSKISFGGWGADGLIKLIESELSDIVERQKGLIADELEAGKILK